MNYKNIVDEQINFLKDKQNNMKGKTMDVSAVCEVCKTIAELAQIGSNLPKQPETK